MLPNTFSNIFQLLEFLRTKFAGPFYSYGSSHEYVQAADGSPSIAPALKPRFFFRGQVQAYENLVPTLFRRYPHIHKFSLHSQIHLQSKSGPESVVLPNPHYNRELDRDLHFSYIKVLEIQELLGRQFSNFPRGINAGALCQHYGFQTPLLDFTEELDAAAFFATHFFNSENRIWIRANKGLGIIYLLDSRNLPSEMPFHEIGIQPLPRPFAQRGSLILIPPGINLLDQPELALFSFEQIENDNKQLEEMIGGFERFFPEDPYADFISKKASEHFVTKSAFEKYLLGYSQERRDKIREIVVDLFKDEIELKQDAP